MHVGWLSACTIFFCFLVQDRFVNALPWSVALMLNWQITSELKDREFVFFFLSENMLEGSVPLSRLMIWMVFKIGSKKELLPISDHLLEHCKDFIRKWSWSNVSWAFATPVHTKWNFLWEICSSYPLEHMADILKTKAQGASWILLFSFDSSAQNWYSEPMQFKSTKVCPYPKFTLHLFYNVYSFTHLCRIKLL